MLFGRHIVELNATNNSLVRSYVWGLDLSGTMGGAGGVGGLLWVTLHTASGPAAGAHFAAYDGNGNVVGLVSATTGTETARYEYGPFAEPIRLTGPAANQNPFRFSTKRTESTTDLVLYEFRAYSPTLGRWLNRDPIEEDGGYSLYCALLNSPIEYVDPDGLDPKKPKPPKPPKKPPKLPNPAKRAAYCAAKCAAEAGLEKVGQWINEQFYCGRLSALCVTNGGLPTIEELFGGDDVGIGKELWEKFYRCFVDCMGGSDYSITGKPRNGSISCDEVRQHVVVKYTVVLTVTVNGQVVTVREIPSGFVCKDVTYGYCCVACDN